MDWEKITDKMDETQIIVKSVITVLFLAIGGFGNIISIFIFNSKKFKKLPAKFYLNAACILSLVTILYMPIMLLANIWVLNSVTCKVYQGIFGLIIRLQAWIVAFGSIDRLISIFKPNKYNIKNGFYFHVCVVVAISILMIIFVCPILYFSNSVTKGNVTFCSFVNEPLWIWNYYKIEYLFIRVVLPFLFMLTSSLIITLKMCKSKKKLTGKLRREKQLFISLIAFDLFFILFRMPMVIYSFINPISNTFFVSLTYAILLSTGLMCNVFNFLIFLLFNKTYRDVFISIISCRIHRFQRQNSLIIVFKKN